MGALGYEPPRFPPVASRPAGGLSVWGGHGDVTSSFGERFPIPLPPNLPRCLPGDAERANRAGGSPGDRRVFRNWVAGSKCYKLLIVSAEELLARSLKLLQGAIRASGLTQTEVDGKIRRRRGFLSHVFQRRVDLKLVDLLRALEILGIEPRQFFQVVIQGRSGTGPDVMHLLADRLKPAPEGASVEPVESALQDQVRQAVREILAETDLNVS